MQQQTAALQLQTQASVVPAKADIVGLENTNNTAIPAPAPASAIATAPEPLVQLTTPPVAAEAQHTPPTSVMQAVPAPVTATAQAPAPAPAPQPALATPALNTGAAAAPASSLPPPSSSAAAAVQGGDVAALMASPARPAWEASESGIPRTYVGIPNWGQYYEYALFRPPPLPSTACFSLFLFSSFHHHHHLLLLLVSPSFTALHPRHQPWGRACTVAGPNCTRASVVGGLDGQEAAGGEASVPGAVWGCDSDH